MTIVLINENQSINQGSVLGPLFFLLYTAEVFDVIAEWVLVGHSYADDTQTYISIPAADATSAVQQFVICVGLIELWLGSNRLKSNADKTQVVSELDLDCSLTKSIFQRYSCSL